MDFIIALNRPALLEARQRAEEVLRGGLGTLFEAYNNSNDQRDKQRHREET